MPASVGGQGGRPRKERRPREARKGEGQGREKAKGGQEGRKPGKAKGGGQRDNKCRLIVF